MRDRSANGLFHFVMLNFMKNLADPEYFSNVPTYFGELVFSISLYKNC